MPCAATLYHNGNERLYHRPSSFPTAPSTSFVAQPYSRVFRTAKISTSKTIKAAKRSRIMPGTNDRRNEHTSVTSDELRLRLCLHAPRFFLGFWVFLVVALVVFGHRLRVFSLTNFSYLLRPSRFRKTYYWVFPWGLCTRPFFLPLTFSIPSAVYMFVV